MIIPNETRDFGMVNLALGSSMYPSVRYVAQKEPGWFIQLIPRFWSYLICLICALQPEKPRCCPSPMVMKRVNGNSPFSSIIFAYTVLMPIQFGDFPAGHVWWHPGDPIQYPILNHD